MGLDTDSQDPKKMYDEGAMRRSFALGAISGALFTFGAVSVVSALVGVANSSPTEYACKGGCKNAPVVIRLVQPPRRVSPNTFSLRGVVTEYDGGTLPLNRELIFNSTAGDLVSMNAGDLVHFLCQLEDGGTRIIRCDEPRLLSTE